MSNSPNKPKPMHRTPITQDRVSQPLVLVTLDVLDELAEIAAETGNTYASGRINAAYRAVELFKANPATVTA